MNTPGFNAAASVYRSSLHYAVLGGGAAGNFVPQGPAPLPPGPGGGLGGWGFGWLGLGSHPSWRPCEPCYVDPVTGDGSRVCYLQGPTLGWPPQWKSYPILMPCCAPDCTGTCCTVWTDAWPPVVGHCTDLQSDPANCGDCGVTCLGQTCCSGHCTDVSTDLNNCGKCGDACGSGQCCSGQCTDVSTDVNNCRYCGDHCVTGTTCCKGNCVSTLCDLTKETWVQAECQCACNTPQCNDGGCCPPGKQCCSSGNGCCCRDGSACDKDNMQCCGPDSQGHYGCWSNLLTCCGADTLACDLATSECCGPGVIIGHKFCCGHCGTDQKTGQVACCDPQFTPPAGCCGGDLNPC